MAVKQMSPVELERLRLEGRAPVVLDVREPVELQLAALPDVLHIPMREIARRALSALDPDAPVVVLCHHGVRSMSVANWLVDHDFEEVWNLAGGIDRWSVDVDDGTPRY
jgi:rhodanese-related sulfurtransferase